MFLVGSVLNLMTIIVVCLIVPNGLVWPNIGYFLILMLELGNITRSLPERGNYKSFGSHYMTNWHEKLNHFDVNYEKIVLIDILLFFFSKFWFFSEF